MPVARKCAFCGKRLNPGTGLMLVKRDGATHTFCTSKCERNFGLGRKPYRVKWTESSRKSRGKA